MRDSRWHGLVLALVLPSMVLGQTQPLDPDASAYKYHPLSHQEDGYTPSDMVLYDGFGKTVIFQILNLTPYNIRYTGSSFVDIGAEPWALDRTLAKAFAFAPVGVPSTIPPGTSDLQGTIGVPGAHPRFFVVSWNDDPDTILRTRINWVVEGVDFLSCTLRTDPSTCTSEQTDVYLGLWMSRTEPPDPLESGIAANVFNVLNGLFSVLGVLGDVWNPLSWWAIFSATYALVDNPPDEFVEQQTQPGDGRKMYVSAYPLPAFDRECFQKNNLGTWLDTGNTGEPDKYRPCAPGTMDGQSSDGYEAQWADTHSGPAPAELVVLTSLIRGKKDGLSYHLDYKPATVPQIMITLITATQYETEKMFLLAQAPPPMAGAVPGVLDLENEKVVKEIRKFRDKYGAEGRRAAQTIIAGMAPGQREYLSEAVHTLRQHRPISKEEEMFVLGLIKQSEKYIRDSQKKASEEG